MHAWKLAFLVTALLSLEIEGFLFLFPFRPFDENPWSPPPSEPPDTYVSTDCSTKLSELSTNVYVTEDLDYGVCPGDTESILVGGMPALDLGSLSTGKIYEYYELEYGNTKCTTEGNCCVLEVMLEPYSGDTESIVGAQEMSMLFRGPECRNFALSGTVLTSTSGMVKMFNYSTSDTEYRLRDLGLVACETEGVIGSVQRATFCTHP